MPDNLLLYRAVRRYTELGKRIRAARHTKGWSQKTLAELLGTSSQRIILWEKGANRPNPRYRKLLAGLLGVSDWSPDPEPDDEIQKRAGEIYDKRVEGYAA